MLTAGDTKVNIYINEVQSRMTKKQQVLVSMLCRVEPQPLRLQGCTDAQQGYGGSGKLHLIERPSHSQS
ncbi:hypothetical protein E2C01_030101 [Portunus trituberculatus]|uniref:Uncharacterized protein n=1 Tax=Portunus trituberculatus TaxID=210409 RepID=A0A5B7EWE6_PORTR|nr:hypothetical protein [Portunus trituberculatus]